MLVWPLLEIDVVEETDDSPEIGLVGVTEFVSVPAHDTLDRCSVLEVEGFLVVCCKQVPCLFSCHPYNFLS